MKTVNANIVLRDASSALLMHALNVRVKKDGNWSTPHVCVGRAISILHFLALVVLLLLTIASLVHLFSGVRPVKMDTF